jgi:hypothetical protein
MNTSNQALNLPQGMPPQTSVCIENAVRDVLTKHGSSAFHMSREAALAHEAGHVIVGAHEGVFFRSVTISSRVVPVFGTAWGGWCASDAGWTTGPDTTAESDLSRARIVIAGFVAEALTGWDKPGSSIEERAVTSVLVNNAANKLGKHLSPAEFEPYALRLGDEQVWNVTVAILRHNHEPFLHLIEQLHQHGKVKGRALRDIITKVKRIA